MVQREGELSGLAHIIADLIDGNLVASPERSELLTGRRRTFNITATDLDAHVALTIGDGRIVVAGSPPPKVDLWIRTDSSTLLDLPNARLLAGLPSPFDPVGRGVAGKMLSGKLRVSGVWRLGLLSRVQRLLSVV